MQIFQHQFCNNVCTFLLFYSVSTFVLTVPRCTQLTLCSQPCRNTAIQRDNCYSSGVSPSGLVLHILNLNMFRSLPITHGLYVMSTSNRQLTRLRAVVRSCSWVEIGLSTKNTRFRILCFRVKPLLRCTCSSSLNCMNEYLAIDSGDYLCTSSFRELIAAWLNVSQRSRDGVRLNRFAME